jgi:NCS2 family nucleobase:cation symporter-2
LLGGIGQSTFSSNVGLSLATGATSRSIAIPCGILMILLAFLPKLAALFAVMPDPVIGAIVVYVACYMILAGIQVITSRMLDARRIFVVGIALIFPECRHGSRLTANVPIISSHSFRRLLASLTVHSSWF